MAVIDVRGLGKRYPGQRGAPALADVDLMIQDGAVLGLIGPNGAGKTTLIKILSGLLVPDSGSGTVLGYDLLRHSRQIRGAVSLVAPTADVGIDNNLTVRQNLVFWAPVYGLTGLVARRRIDELLARLGLEAKADAWPMHISAGQRQRLAIARSLLAEHALVFLDEPTNKLDADGVRSVRQLIRELNTSHGVTVVLTTHVMEEAEELCTEVAFLAEGRLRRHMPTSEVLRSLSLVRPIRVQLALASASVFQPPDATAFSGAIRVECRPGSVPGEMALTVWSEDTLRTTPELLRWVFFSGCRLVGMATEWVTLEDVFHVLAADGGPS